jgi:hypothetical protein
MSAVTFVDKYLRSTAGFAALRATIDLAAIAQGVTQSALDASITELASGGAIVVEIVDGQTWVFHSAAQDEADEASVKSLWKDQQDPTAIVKGALVAAGFCGRSSRRSYRLVGLLLDQALTRIPDDTGFHNAIVDIRNHVDFVAGRLA